MGRESALTCLTQAAARLLCQPSADFAEMAALTKRSPAAKSTAKGDKATAALDAASLDRLSSVAAMGLGCCEVMYEER